MQSDFQKTALRYCLAFVVLIGRSIGRSMTQNIAGLPVKALLFLVHHDAASHLTQFVDLSNPKVYEVMQQAKMSLSA